MSLWQVASGIIGVLGGLFGIVCGVWSIVYARQQVRIMKGQMHRQEVQNKEEQDWSERFDRLAHQLVRISPRLTIKPTGYSEGVALYPAIFPDPKLREALETYVVQLDMPTTPFLPRNLRPDELRRTIVRDTIRKAEQSMAVFQTQNPKIDLKYYTG